MTTAHVSRPGVHPHEHDGATLPDPPPPYSPAPYRHPRTNFGSSFLRPHSRKSSSSSPDSAARTPRLFAPLTTIIQTPAELASWMATGPLAGPPSPALPGSPTTPSRPRPTFNVGSPRDDRRHSRGGWMNGGDAHDQSTNGRGSGGGSTDSSDSTDEDEDMQLPRLRHGHSHPNNGHIQVSHNGHTHIVDPHHPPAHDKLWHERSAAFDRVAARVESPPRVRDGSAGVHWRERIEPEPSTEPKRDSGFFDETEPPVKRRPTPTIDLSGLRLAGEPVTATKDEEKKPEGAAVPFPTPDAKTTAELAPAQGSVPFPTGSPTTSGPPSPGLLPRTPSTPIILSNGKPLKPSLKSSSSSPSIANLPLHARSRSAPSTPGNLLLSSAPGTPKNVHFPTRAEELQSVRLFRPAGRPTAVSLDRGAEDTETETEGYDSSAVGGYPFPVTPPQPAQDSIIVMNTGLTSPVPAPSATHPHHGGGQMYSNVHLETLTLPKTRPYTLVGSVLVRNVAYHKQVAIRFTLDDWQTTSEVTSHYVASVPQLPPPFFESRSSPLVGDALTSLSHASVGWDRFAWQIKLEDVTERRLVEKTLYLVVRYTANGDGGGEWWDNNSGANYRVVFKKEATPVKTGAPSPASAASRALAHAIRAENRSGGLPPLQLRNKRPSLTQSLSFGNVPRAVSAGGRPGSPTIDTSVPAAGTNSPPKAPHSPVSPVRGLSLKNYVAPNKTPPPVLQPLPIAVQQPSPPRSPVRTGSPVPELTTREIVLEGGQPVSVPVPLGANGSSFAAALAASVRASSPVPSPSPSPPPMTLGPSTSPNGPTSASAPSPSWRSNSNGTTNGVPQLTLATRGQINFSRGAFGGSEDNSPNGVDADPSPFPNDGHSIAGPMSPIGSPATNASYEALVKQWCFGGSPSMYTPSSEPRYGAPAGGFADQSYHAAVHSFGAGGSMARTGHVNGRVHGKSASEPEWFRQASSPGMLVGVGDLA